MKSFGKKSAANICYWLVNISWYLSWLISIILLIGITIEHFKGSYITGITVKLAESMVSVEAGPLSNYLAVETVKAELNYGYILQHNPAIYYINFVYMLLVVALFLFGLYQLRKLLKATVNETVFTKPNIRRIKTIAILLIAWGPLRWLHHNFIVGSIKGFLYKSGFTIGVDLPIIFDYLTVGLIIYALATVFEKGYEMYQELKLTV